MVSPFRIAPQRRRRALVFPEARAFSPEILRQRPYRSGVSRALAAAMATLASGGAMAQGLWSTARNPDTQFMLEGSVAHMPQPMIADLIDPQAAEALIGRLFAETGFTLSFEGHGFGKITDTVDGWDAGHRVGVALLDARDFSSERVYAHFLERTLGMNTHLAEDPRDRIADWREGLTPKEQDEVTRATAAFGQHPRARGTGSVHGVTADGTQILWFDPCDLMVGQSSPSQASDAAALVQQRAEALRRLEGQVRGFLDYLSSQGIGG